MDGQDSEEPMARQGRTVDLLGDQPCCGINGAGTDGPRELTWTPGSWSGWGSGPPRPTSALRALTYRSLDNPSVLCFCFPKYCDNNFMVIILIKSIRQN